jgi:hypothetical protein
MQNSFEPHEIALFRRVIDIVCAEMGKCDEGTETYIAHRILCRAQRGSWDFTTLLCAARLDAKPSFATRQMETVH